MPNNRHIEAGAIGMMRASIECFREILASITVHFNPSSLEDCRRVMSDWLCLFSKQAAERGFGVISRIS